MEEVIYNPDTSQKAKITKANRLVEARYRLTIQEQRLILMYISLLSPNSEEFPVIRLKVKDVIETLDLKGESFYQELKKILKRLLTRVVEIPQGEKDYLLVHWVESARYRHKEGEIILRLNPDLKPYLLKLKEAFTTYYLKNALRLRSFYSVRLYELLKQYERIGVRTLSIEKLRSLLKIEPNEYARYNDFKRFVILSSQKELAEKTDLSFEFREVKQGRKVVALEFKIYKTHNKDVLQLPTSQETVKSFSALSDRAKEIIVDYLRSKDGVKNPIALARTLKGFELEETSYEALKWYVKDNHELAEELDKKKEENPQLTWTELLEYAVNYETVLS